MDSTSNAASSSGSGRREAPVEMHEKEPRGYANPYPFGAPPPMAQKLQLIAPPPQFRRFGNAAALGLITFGICTVQESMMQAGMS
ncbi:hypothetical protein EV175_007550, partial [Coemansia sp. RSA 1933]